MPESKLELQFRNRRLVIDALAAVPPWMFGAIAWLAFSELILKRVYPDEFVAMQGALLAADVVSELPPGVAIVATLYSTLYLAEKAEDFWEALAQTAGQIPDTFVKSLVKGANTFILSLAKVTGL
ncbi:MAG TPA: hypothetical protein EYG65_00625 [Rhodospirillales bacterium]|nr:hypothetical protein [Rhodospirillales bacterium]